MPPLVIPSELDRTRLLLEESHDSARSASTDKRHLEQFASKLDSSIRTLPSVIQHIEQRDLLLHQEAYDNPDSFTEDKAEEIIGFYRALATMLPNFESLIASARDRGLELMNHEEALKGLRQAKAAVAYHERVASGDEDEMPDWLVDLADQAIQAHDRGESVPFEEMGD